MTKAQAPANEEIYQKTSVMAQKFLGNQPVVVLGTGATIPLGLPSMPQLADELTSSIPPEQPGWDEFTQSLESSGDLEQALSNSDLPEETVDIIVTKTWELVSAKDLECYSRIQNGGVFDLADLFRYLLRIANPHLRVITTNYDRVAEYAANIVSAHVTTGMTTGWHQRFVSRCRECY